MNTKVIISIGVVLLLIVAIAGGSYLVLNRQNIFSQAQQLATGQDSSCPAPETPASVEVTYPLCTGNTCQFDQAGCNWSSVPSASKYNLKVTEVETGVNIKTEEVTGTSTSFPVVQGRTYKCEVSAVNACGTVGGTNQDSLLCQVDLQVSPTPTPVPTAPSVVATPPPAAPVPTPTPVACGFTGCSQTVPCQAGFVCVETSTGNNFCAKTEYQNQCFRTPGQGACCQPPPTPIPTLAPAGAIDLTLMIGGAGVGLVILGAAALLLL